MLFILLKKFVMTILANELASIPVRSNEIKILCKLNGDSFEKVDKNQLILKNMAKMNTVKKLFM
jgi:hypothetical protein